MILKYDANHNYNRLPLKNLMNVRDLGGIAAEKGMPTRWHVFLRSDDTYELDESDRDFLLKYGLKTVIDLRAPYELRTKADPFSNDNEITYHNIPLYEDDIIDLMNSDHFKIDEFTLGKMYVNILKNSHANIKHLFHILAETEGCTLFHCTAGKDRTGIAAALILMLVGASEEDVIANYEVTNTYLMRILKKVMYITPDLPEAVLSSSRENILTVIDYINSEFGTAEKYLLSIGVYPADIKLIKNKLIG